VQGNEDRFELWLRVLDSDVFDCRLGANDERRMSRGWPPWGEEKQQRRLPVHPIGTESLEEQSQSFGVDQYVGRGQGLHHCVFSLNNRADAPRRIVGPGQSQELHARTPNPHDSLHRVGGMAYDEDRPSAIQDKATGRYHNEWEYLTTSPQR
jgi:hypothetical protein